MAGLTKGILLSRVRDACDRAGWSTSRLRDGNVPILLGLTRAHESFRARIYIWTITHGGGSRRAPDEYRIQVTGVQQFDTAPSARTVILGYFPERHVFAGWDVRKHSGVLGFSPSLQIGRGALEAASAGYAVHRKANGEHAIAFLPDYLPDYLRYSDVIHDTGALPAEFDATVEHLTEMPSPDEAVAELPGVSGETARSLVAVARLRRDNSFRIRVLSAYRNMCAVCGAQLRLVDAAHIVPVSADGATDETTNGLCLCANHHRAYDNGVLGIFPDYSVHLHRERVGQLRELGLISGLESFESTLPATIIPPVEPSLRPNPAYLERGLHLREW